MLLEKIQSPDDVKALDVRQLPALCAELRRFLLDNVSRTGGHLASNLGAVELTVAIHRVFDTSRDRLVFDVGHQCYVHKALTGRRELFATLRQFRGLSGFPKPYESVHDAFIAGHASNSVSVALGMARARTLSGMDYSVLALIGDGAMTGGLSYEGMNNAGASGEPLIVILNDNGMSISPNVGGLSAHLNHLRSKPAYYHFKKYYRRLFGKHPIRNPLYRFIHRGKTLLKQAIFPGSTLFEDMGFTYLGPVDGHDIERLCTVLQWAKELNGPVLIHVRTVKGRGYVHAERNPDRFHGPGPFDADSGRPLKSGGPDFSHVFGETLVECAAENPRICAVTAAMSDGTGLNAFAEAYPERFFDVAIAEGHGVSMSAGLAAQGMIPVFAVYSTFLQRGYDMLAHDVALEHLHAVFGVDRAGLVGADGETHHGCMDALYLSQIPGFTVMCPANFAELRSMLRQALFEASGPVAVRYPRGGEGAFRADTSGRNLVRVYPADDNTPPDTDEETPDAGKIILLSYGILINHLLDAARTLDADNLPVEVWKLNRIAPLDADELGRVCGGCRALLVLEDCFRTGCAGERIAAALLERGTPPRKLILRNAGNGFVSAGSVPELERMLGLDAQGVVEALREAL
ncbi:MAG: 1-deoxy-D-xylulose-5-phosphate synthase [Oscillibacter sp.]|nr:1-deoxy-D-xylulose-5-phosphate synthase [Oscillibacter sp.]